MHFVIPTLPDGYRTLEGPEWSSFPGKIAGSAQPGGYYNKNNTFNSLKLLKNGVTLEQAGINEDLLSNLDALYQVGIRHIYNLIIIPSETGNPELTKQIWETRFTDTKYITEIDGVKIGIEDFTPPTQDQLKLITDDVLQKIKNSENVLIHCRGGIGRTGTILAAIYMKAHNEYDADKAIQYIRNTYSRHAIETYTQEESLRVFSRSLQELNTEVHPLTKIEFEVNNNSSSFVHKFMSSFTKRNKEKPNAITK